jgi:hypothetical protein
MIKSILTVAFLVLGIFLISGCEKNDYQHPLHRANSDSK